MSHGTYDNDPEKTCNVVFERLNSMSDEETLSDNDILDTPSKTITKDLTKQELWRKIDKQQKGHVAKHSEENKFYGLLDTVVNCTSEEKRATETFLTSVEQMMSINKDIGKLQDTYKHIMEKLPKN